MKKLIEALIKLSTGKYAAGYYVSAFALCFTLAFYGLGQISKISFDNPPGYHSVQVVSLEHKIKTLEHRINDVESGAYARRIASLVDGNLSSEALRTCTVINKLHGDLAEEKRELEEAKRSYAKVTGHEWTDESGYQEVVPVKSISLAKVF